MAICAITQKYMDSKQPAGIEQLLALHVTELQLNLANCNLLANANINTLGDLVAAPASKLIKVLGARRFAAVESQVAALGLKLSR